MRLQSYQDMLTDYGISDLAADDKNSRDEMLSLYQYSVIFEGEYSEIDNLNKWIELNFGINDPKYLFYGKTSYDYGFAEYFFPDKFQAEEVSRVIPHIYTIYPKSLSPNQPVKSNGYHEIIKYNPMDPEAIILR